MEEYRGRCDDLFADLMECQEQLRVERSRNDCARDASGLERSCCCVWIANT